MSQPFVANTALWSRLSWRRWGFFYALLVGLWGCEQPGLAPVERVDGYQVAKPQAVHIVRSGETLYAIARRYKLDFRELAQANGLKAPYTLSVGQRIKLSGQRHQVAKGETLFAIAWRYSLDYRDLARWNQIPAPYTIYPGQWLSLRGQAISPTAATQPKPSTAQPKAVPPVVKAAPKPKSQPKNNTQNPVSNKVTLGPVAQWHWPVRGKILCGFSTQVNGCKGLDIAAPFATPVKATAAGRVVYAGSGLRGYGNLLIIKHNDEYFSAYAHNRTLNVVEGEAVKAQQVIAEVGNTGADRVKLHFQIRRNGKPIDPKKLLP